MIGFDAALFDLLNQGWASSFLDRFLPVFSSFDAWEPIMVAAAILLAVFGQSGGRLFLLSVVLGLVVGDTLISQALKRSVDRPRPRDVHEGTIVRSLSPEKPRIFHVFDPPVIRVEGAAQSGKHGRSFPSSHVLNVFMLATVAFRFHRVAGGILAIGGLLVAWSRIYCGAHWPSDIPPSILLGIAVGWGATYLVKELSRARGWSGFPRGLPRPVANSGVGSAWSR